MITAQAAIRTPFGASRAIAAMVIARAPASQASRVGQAERDARLAAARVVDRDADLFGRRGAAVAGSSPRDGTNVEPGAGSMTAYPPPAGAPAASSTPKTSRSAPPRP